MIRSDAPVSSAFGGFTKHRNRLMNKQRSGRQVGAVDAVAAVATQVRLALMFSNLVKEVE